MAAIEANSHRQLTLTAVAAKSSVIELCRKSVDTFTSDRSQTRLLFHSRSMFITTRAAMFAAMFARSLASREQGR